MLTKEACVEKYQECKRSMNGKVPERNEFLQFAGIAGKKLEAVFGASPYTKLQNAAGDVPKKLVLERTPVATIMSQYGHLIIECNSVPVYAEWSSRRLRPTDSGLKNTHGIKWTEMPNKFLAWVNETKAVGFERATEIVSSSLPQKGSPL